MRPRWDCDRLFGPGPSLLPAGAGGSLLGSRARAILDEAAAVVREVTAGLGAGREVVGLIHKDFEPDNLVVSNGELHAIDFADCGWGWYLYDVAAALLPLREKPGYAGLERSFLAGYRRVRPGAGQDPALLAAFTVARSLFAVRLMVLRTMEIPKVRDYARVAVPRMVGGIRRYLEGRGSRSGRGGAERRTTVQLLSRLRARGVDVWLDGARLRYRAPPGALTEALRGELAQRKAEIVAFLGQGTAPREEGPRRATGPGSGPHSDRSPASFSQRRLWFLHRLDPESVEYNIARAVRLAGRLRVPVLARALAEVVRRHGTLRTRFAVVDGEPVQVVEPDLGVPLPVVDLAGLPAGRRGDEAQSVSADLARRPFDLSRAPLLRIVLLRLGEEEHAAASSMHHVIGDGWSTGLLFREMGLLYEAFAAARPSPLPELEIQYTDFAAWQRRQVAGARLEGLLAYWREALAGAPQVLELPADRPRPTRPRAAADRERGDLPAELAGGLKALAQEEGATLFMALFAAFAETVGRFAGRRDLLVGSPVASRGRTELEGLIGFFVNTLVLRARLEGAPSFRELLRRSRATTLGAYSHQDLPFEKLVEALAPARRLDLFPLVQVQCSLQNVPHPDLQVGAIRMSLLPPVARASEIDLSCDMKEMPEGVRTSFKYRLAVLDRTTAARMARGFQALIEAAVAEPDRPVAELPLLSRAERHVLTHEWNDTATARPGPASIPERFARRAARASDAVALVFGREHWSYGALAARAGRLARRLRRLGVGPETPVGVSVERSAELPVALLGVLEAGGCYVPLDPSYPPARLARMLAESGAPVVVVDQAPEAATAGPVGEAGPVRVRVGAPDEGGDPAGPGLASPALGGDHAVYTIFTSGSTGRPKGAVNSHRAVLNRLLWMEEAFHLTAADRVLQKTPFSFDVSAWEASAPSSPGRRW